MSATVQKLVRNALDTGADLARRKPLARVTSTSRAPAMRMDPSGQRLRSAPLRGAPP